MQVTGVDLDDPGIGDRRGDVVIAAGRDQKSTLVDEAVGSGIVCAEISRRTVQGEGSTTYQYRPAVVERGGRKIGTKGHRCARPDIDLPGGGSSAVQVQVTGVDLDDPGIGDRHGDVVIAAGRDQKSTLVEEAVVSGIGGAEIARPTIQVERRARLVDQGGAISGAGSELDSIPAIDRA